jgi:hypothetical protein
MRQLGPLDLDLIKQAEQGWGRFGNVDCVHLCAGSMKAATNGSVLGGLALVARRG